MDNKLKLHVIDVDRTAQTATFRDCDIVFTLQKHGAFYRVIHSENGRPTPAQYKRGIAYFCAIFYPITKHSHAAATL